MHTEYIVKKTRKNCNNICAIQTLLHGAREFCSISLEKGMGTTFGVRAKLSQTET